MPVDRHLTAKQRAFVQYYADPGSKTYNNGTKSARKAGYAYNSADVRAVELVVNSKIISEISVYKDKIALKCKITRESQSKRLDVLHDMALDQKNVTAAKGCIAEQNEMFGLRQEKGVNKEDLAGIRSRMDDEERRLSAENAERQTALRTYKIGS